VLLIAEHFLEQLNQREGTSKLLSRQCRSELRHYSWPGNVRELKNTISRAFILADRQIDVPPQHFTGGRRKPTRRDNFIQVPVGTPLVEAHYEMMLAALEHFGGDKRKAAESLGVSLKTLYNLLAAHRSSSRAAENQAAR
jgi:DNA-binding NtrC family response regulator